MYRGLELEPDLHFRDGSVKALRVNLVPPLPSSYKRYWIVHEPKPLTLIATTAAGNAVSDTQGWCMSIVLHAVSVSSRDMLLGWSTASAAVHEGQSPHVSLFTLCGTFFVHCEGTLTHNSHLYPFPLWGQYGQVSSLPPQVLPQGGGSYRPQLSCVPQQKGQEEGSSHCRQRKE